MYGLFPQRWAGLPASHQLARDTSSGKELFFRFDAPQLLKHALGLRREYGVRRFELVYLYYHVPSKEADQHVMEVDRFTDRIAGEICFRSMTYQEPFSNQKVVAADHKDYLDYLADRYFW